MCLRSEQGSSAYGFGGAESPEVAADGPRAEGEFVDPFGEDVGDVVRLLEHAVDEQGAGVAGNKSVPSEDGLRDDDVDQPGFASRLMKVTPPALGGRCRWVTMPPTSTRVRSWRALLRWSIGSWLGRLAR